MNSLTYKMATEKEELQQIHQLNYQTFVEEIPQHEKNAIHELVDKFHEENTYVIAKQGMEVVGMIAVRGRRPFSLDQKLEKLDDYLPEGAVPCEIRLLSVKKKWRSTQTFYKLVDRLVSYCLEKQYTVALISGTVRQLKLYKRIGFIPFGTLVGKEDAQFQPMYLTRESFASSTKAFQRLMVRKQPPVHSFLPGPVQLSADVKKAFTQPALSHRASDFRFHFQQLQDELTTLTKAAHVQILVGTGTLANDVVAAQLIGLKGKGLILSNGEFGERLIDHASRLGLSFKTLKKEWNEALDLKDIKNYLDADAEIKWLWTVHCETSTGYLYDLKNLQTLCKKYDVELCLDACSSAGLVPLNLKEVLFASSVSGKGFGSYPGLAIIFHREAVLPNPVIPRYLDLGLYAENSGIAFTHSSNLILALKEAVNTVDYRQTQELSYRIRTLFKESTMRTLGDHSYSPGIITLALPEGISSKRFGDACKMRGVLLSYESNYLLERNWVQLALMGDHPEAACIKAAEVVKETYSSTLKENGLSLC
ncbi:aminotransferase class V-fold PLP-dependent enzyme [Jeotgalibacillus campisalis]|uniref:Septum site-determining protein n=1 Tax=Jeotgalibacillus campisalis TaxID=220754 RepID=A0A0C2RRJ6_9BACL|nr:aminotransferase class V-fold PLP-dependent enzyme [Jeotgalibacillus campisalis]KIL52890.1 septum site-determining protein [Jeotgalibacillus campisalis]